MNKTTIVYLAFLFMLLPCSGFGEDLYLTQAASGGDTGADCANAHAVTFFNTSGNWGAGAGKISAGDTVHLCGTFTASSGESGYMAFQGSGSAGNPVTLKFETGAVVKAAYWGSNGAIYSSGKSYLTIDGGTNGIVEATLNGTSGAGCIGGACSSQVDNTTGILLSSCATCEVKNLHITNLYLHTSTSDNSGTTYAIEINDGSTVTIDGNTIQNASQGIFLIANPGGGISNILINGNTFVNVSSGVWGGDGGSGGVISNVNIYNNIYHDAGNWDTISDDFHHEAVYIWITLAGSSFTGVYNVYNNYFYNLGNNCTALIYFDNGATSTYPNATAFNNVLDLGQQTCGDGAIYDKSGKMRAYNNTVIQGIFNSVAGSGTQIFKNNISGANEVFLMTTASISSSDYNDWYALSGNPVMTYNNVGYSTFAAYKSATGFDSHTITSSPNLTAGFVPNAGSPVIGAGTNLYSTCNGQPNPGLGALCYDKAGVARPTSAAWDIGAYQFASGGPTVPTVSTTAATSITQTTASAGGNVTSDGGASVTARGTAYGTSANPTSPCTGDGTGTGSFTSSLSGLSAVTLYYYRACATNSAGTGYGSDLIFTTATPPIGPVTGPPPLMIVFNEPSTRRD